MKNLAFEKPDVGHEVFRRLREFSCLRLKEMAGLLGKAANEWFDVKASRLGASLAFYTLLSLAPVVIIVVSVAALVFGQEAARGQLVWQIQDFVGPEGARVIQELIQSAHRPATGLLASLGGALMLIFGASAVVVDLRDSLNTIWRVPLDNRSLCLATFFRVAKERFYSAAMILTVGFLLLVSVALAAMGKFFHSFLPVPEAFLHAAAFVFSSFILTLLFATIYKCLPDVHLEWSDVAIGASVTALLFAIGKEMIGLYLGKAGFGSTYGAAGSLVVVLFWVYYSAQLFFFGAAFTVVYTRTFGSHFSTKLEPSPPSVRGTAVVILSTTGTAPENDRPRVLEYEG